MNFRYISLFSILLWCKVAVATTPDTDGKIEEIPAPLLSAVPGKTTTPAVATPVKISAMEDKSEVREESPHSTKVEELISRGSFDEIDQKVLGLLTKDLASAKQEDINKIIHLNDYLVGKNHKGAIRRKILWLTNGKILERRIPSFTGYSIKYCGAYLDRIMNESHAREPFWVSSDLSPPHLQDVDAAKKLEELLAKLQ